MNIENCWYKKNCNKKCDDNCIRYMEMVNLIETSRIPKASQLRNELIPEKIDIKQFQRLAEIKKNIVDFVSKGKSIYIYSQNFGNGKTTWSIKLLQAYFNKIWAGNGFRQRGLFIHVPSFLSKFKDVINRKDESFEDLKHQLLEVDLVVWDDIASSKLSDYDHVNLLTYIDQRKLEGKSNIYTGNLNEEELTIALGNRLKSRVWNDSEIIQFFGTDRREG